MSTTCTYTKLHHTQVTPYTHTLTHTHTVYDDLPTLEEEAKAAEADAEQVAIQRSTVLKPKDEKTITKRNLSLTGQPSELELSSKHRDQQDTILMDYETELRNDYGMIGGTGYCSIQLHKETSESETAV